MIKRQSRHVFLMSSAADNGCSAPLAVIKCTIGVVIELVTSEEQLQTDRQTDIRMHPGSAQPYRQTAVDCESCLRLITLCDCRSLSAGLVFVK